MEDGGYGKSARSRRHKTSKAQTPYSRPAPVRKEDDAPAENLQLVEASNSKGSLFGSVFTAASTPFKAAANLINKVPLFGGYFRTASVSEEIESSDDKGASEEDDSANSGCVDEDMRQQDANGQENLNGLQPRQRKLQHLQQRDGEEGHAADGHAGAQEDGEVRGTPLPPPRSRAQNGDDPLHTTPQPGPAELAAAGTPYDNVLAMLRQGPMSMNSPRFTFRPRSGSGQPSLSALRSSPAASRYAPYPSPPLFNAGQTPGPPGRTPMPGVAQHAQQRRPGSSRFAPLQQGTAGGALFGPTAGVAGSSAGAAPRTSTSRVHFAGTPATVGAANKTAGGGGGPAPRAPAHPRFSALPASTQELAAAAASPAPLAWTPMRSSMTPLRGAAGAGTVAGVGAKRKADSKSPDQPGAGDRISLLDAQRRTRQRADPAQGGGSVEKRSWRAGRTPFHTGTASRFGRGAAPRVDTGTQRSPLAGMGGLGARGGMAGGGIPAERSPPKGTTDTARRILATLESLDQVAAAKAASLGEAGYTPHKETAAQAAPPPNDTLGFAGAPRGDRSRGVTFGGVSFAPSPLKADEQQQEAGGKGGQLGGSRGDAAAAPSFKPSQQAGLAAAAKPAAAPAAFGSTLGGSGRGEAAEGGEAAGSDKTAAPFSFGAPPPRASSLQTSSEAPSLRPWAKAADSPRESAADKAAPSFSFGPPAPATSPPSQDGTLANGGGLFGQSVDPAARGGAEGTARSSYKFGGARDAEVDRQVAAVVQAAGGAPAVVRGEEAPHFAFGKRSQQSSTPQASNPASLGDANKLAAEAAQSPLPPLSDDEGDASLLQPSTSPKPAAASGASGGWDLSFLQSNSAAAKKAAAAAAEEAEGGSKASSAPAVSFAFGAPPSSAAAASTTMFSFAAAPFTAPSSSDTGLLSLLGGTAAATSAAGTPAFSFGAATSAPAAPPAESTPAAASGWGADFLQKNKEAAGKATEAAAKEAEGATAPAASSADPGGWGADFLQKNKEAAGKATEAAAKEAEGGATAAAAPVTSEGPSSGWGAAFLQANQAAASQAAEAAAQESEKAGGRAQVAPSSVPLFSFGLPPEAQSAPAAATSSAAPLSFAAPPATLAASAPEGVGAISSYAAPALSSLQGVATSAAFPPSTHVGLFGTSLPSDAQLSAAAAPTSSSEQPLFGGGLSGGVTASAAAATASAGGSFAAPAAVPAFGAVPGAGAGTAAATSSAAPALAFTFGAGAAASSAVPTSAPATSLPLFGGTTPSSAPVFGTSADSTPAASSAPAPSLAFGAAAHGAGPASTPAASQPFTQPLFGAPAAASADSQASGPLGAFGAPSTAASGAQAASEAAPSLFSHSYQPSSNAPQGSSLKLGTAAGSATAPISFAFGAQTAQASAPSFGAPAAAPSFGAPASAPSFGAPASAPSFGAPASAPSFGAPASAPSFGAPASAPTFGAPASAPSFGAPASAPSFGASASAPTFGAPASAPSFGASALAAPPSFGMGNGMDSNGVAFSTGAASGSTPAPSFGAPSAPLTFGQSLQQPGELFGGQGFGAPQQQQQQGPSFGFAPSQQQQQPAPAFGAPQPAPAFGAPGAGGFGFAAQPQAAGAAPFGGDMNPFGGGGMSLGAGGSTSQSEGRRKLKAKRAARK